MAVCVDAKEKTHGAERPAKQAAASAGGSARSYDADKPAECVEESATPHDAVELKRRILLLLKLHAEAKYP